MSISKRIFSKIAEKYVVSEDLLNERRSICEGCDRNVHRFGAQVCAECNCFISAKTAMASAYCPLHKWKALHG